MDELLKDISFKTDDGKLADMFGEKAESIAKKMKSDNKETTSTQFRKFYDKILELNEKAQNLNDKEEFQIKILPFLIMIYSKVKYSYSSKNCGNNFVLLIKKSILNNKVNNKEELQNLKYFLESIIGYMPKK